MSYTIHCECSGIDCNRKLPISLKEYEAVSGHGSVLHPDCESSILSSVVPLLRTDKYVVAVKAGDLGREKRSLQGRQEDLWHDIRRSGIRPTAEEESETPADNTQPRIYDGEKVDGEFILYWCGDDQNWAVQNASDICAGDVYIPVPWLRLFAHHRET